MKGFLVRNLESYGMLKKQGLEKSAVLDATMYTWNNEAVDFWEKQDILKNTVPLELKEAEMRHRDNRNSELIVYGYIPLMQSAQCVRKNIASCDMCEGRIGPEGQIRQGIYSSLCLPPMENRNYKNKRTLL